MSLEASCTEESGGRVQRFTLRAEGELLSRAEFWRRTLTDDAFADSFSRLLAECPQAAFFWETPALTRATLERPFECALVEARGLATLDAEPDVFAEHFRGDNVSAGVATFWNLGGDALLVAPCPSSRTPSAAPAHLASYLRAAPAREARSLWRAVAGALRARLSDEPLWVSTSGLGVAWLHVRLDAQPKYYQYAPYRERPAT